MDANVQFRGELPRYTSKVDKQTPEYAENYQAMTQLVEELRTRLETEGTYQGREEHLRRHLKRGQLLARERVELLLDPDSPFLELMPLAGWGQDGMTVGGSVVVGIGLVCGVECMVTAHVPTLKGGASNEIGTLKGLRAQAIARENRLPCITLIQTAGADLGQQSRVFHPGGGMFRGLAIASKMGIPTCSIVFGSSTAGGAYAPGMSDYVIMVKGQAQVFLGGPPLVKMATGEVTDAEQLGGADMHSRVSGVADQLAADELDAIRKAREFLLGIVQANIRKPFDAREVICRIVDGSRFTEFKPLYGVNIVCCWAYIHGILVGILANNNVIFNAEANKATQFIQLCNLRNAPLIYLQNITGFMVGRQYEEAGIIKAGARFINAVSNSTVPAITVVTGAAYGAGNYAMSGRAYAPRFLWSYPNSRCSVMGADQLAGVMEQVARDSALKAGRAVDEEATAARKAALHSIVEAESDVYYTSSRLLDDGIIDPRDTRAILGLCLSVVYGVEVKGGNLYGVSRM
ncbi:ClpP/crotonase-like domain-containing protein [Thamnocephalis sphaerospora]|uniref:methylcrotonoyl-CoA carboxylase n=1 Tax=Thamnocephalis sphaerospora TaxID=78915 RepID=A0A4P9XI44_9FUNG|nr:ClpP/crotonase-like domain-containing protein [Thamnocephalis sphaerospora]|eukprot:RKP05327.1 ClpP/crotonase-like domain-containing protein [Thamnocephalis sphaerospora]